MSHTAFGDAVGGLNGCAAVLTALIHARRTGKGQFIDLAQIECMMPFAAPWIVAHSIDGKAPVTLRQPPSGFRAAWLLSLRRRRQLDRRRGYLGCDVAEARDAASAAPIGPPMPALATAAAPSRDRDARSKPRSRHGRPRATPDEAMNALQAAGVAAGVARLPIELLEDPQLQARGFIQEVDRAFIGRHPQPSMPFREARRAVSDPHARRRRSANTTAKSSAACSGLSDAEIEQLDRDGIIGTEMLMEEQLVKEKKRAAG